MINRSRFVVLLAGLLVAVVTPGCMLGSEDEVEEDLEAASSEFASDSCSSQAPKCPAKSAPENKGLVKIDRCAFPLSETFDSPGVLNALAKMAPQVSLQQVLGDLNRTGKATRSIAGGPAGVVRGFGWDDEDNDSQEWTPQGITGSVDHSTSGEFAGRKVILSSWYDRGNKGVRIAIVDATGANSKYRFALLVHPTGTPAAPSFQAVNIHAGGLAWVGNYLYVVDTSKGFRVFDMTRILRVEDDSTKSKIGCSGGKCRAFNYRYVIPQIGTYTSRSKCSSRFSFVSVDRSTNPPSLLSGEYCNGDDCDALGGRLFRWELNGSGRINRAYPTEAHLMGQRQVQGAASDEGVFYLSSSAPKGAAGALYRVKVGESKMSRWANGPEDLMIDGTNNLIYSQTETAPRTIFAVSKGSYPAP